MWDHLWIAGSLIVSSLIWISVLSLLAMALSAWVKWRIVAVEQGAGAGAGAVEAGGEAGAGAAGAGEAGVAAGRGVVLSSTVTVPGVVWLVTTRS